MTFNDFATEAYFLAGIISEIEAPSAEQGAKAVTRFNDLMATLLEDGIDLGYAPVASTGSTIVISEGHRLGLKSLLAVSLCGDYGMPIPETALGQARDGMDRLLRQAALLQNTPLNLRTVSHGAGSGYRYNILTDD